jgi:TPR repeat protein
MFTETQQTHLLTVMLEVYDAAACGDIDAYRALTTEADLPRRFSQQLTEEVFSDLLTDEAKAVEESPSQTLAEALCFFTGANQTQRDFSRVATALTSIVSLNPELLKVAGLDSDIDHLKAMCLAHFLLGILYRKGIGIAKSVELANHLFGRAWEQWDCCLSSIPLGEAPGAQKAFTGLEVIVNGEWRVSLQEKKHYRLAHFKQLERYYGAFACEDISLSSAAEQYVGLHEEYFVERADVGCAISQCVLGFYLLNRQKQQSRARQYLTQASEQGNQAAIRCLVNHLARHAPNDETLWFLAYHWYLRAHNKTLFGRSLLRISESNARMLPNLPITTMPMITGAFIEFLTGSHAVDVNEYVTLKNIFNAAGFFDCQQNSSLYASLLEWMVLEIVGSRYHLASDSRRRFLLARLFNPKKNQYYPEEDLAQYVNQPAKHQGHFFSLLKRDQQRLFLGKLIQALLAEPTAQPVYTPICAFGPSLYSAVNALFVFSVRQSLQQAVNGRYQPLAETYGRAPLICSGVEKHVAGYEPESIAGYAKIYIAGMCGPWTDSGNETIAGTAKDILPNIDAVLGFLCVEHYLNPELSLRFRTNLQRHFGETMLDLPDALGEKLLSVLASYHQHRSGCLTDDEFLLYQQGIASLCYGQALGKNLDGYGLKKMPHLPLEAIYVQSSPLQKQALAQYANDALQRFCENKLVRRLRRLPPTSAYYNDFNTVVVLIRRLNGQEQPKPTAEVLQQLSTLCQRQTHSRSASIASTTSVSDQSPRSFIDKPAQKKRTLSSASSFFALPELVVGSHVPAVLSYDEGLFRALEEHTAFCLLALNGALLAPKDVVETSSLSRCAT